MTVRARRIEGRDDQETPRATMNTAGISNGELNREVTTLKRMFTLWIQSGKLLHRPHIPLLREENTRTGFVEPEQFVAAYAHLPPSLGPMVDLAYTSGRPSTPVVPGARAVLDYDWTTSCRPPSRCRVSFATRSWSPPCGAAIWLCSPTWPFTTVPPPRALAKHRRRVRSSDRARALHPDRVSELRPARRVPRRHSAV